MCARCQQDPLQILKGLLDKAKAGVPTRRKSKAISLSAN